MSIVGITFLACVPSHRVFGARPNADQNKFNVTAALGGSLSGREARDEI